MKPTESSPAFVSIPAIGTVAPYAVDPLNRAHVRALIERADAYFRLSARAWEDSTNGGQSRERYRALAHEEQEMADNGTALLAPFGIRVDWPGLYPSFLVNGFGEHTAAAALLAALGHPRDWLA